MLKKLHDTYSKNISCGQAVSKFSALHSIKLRLAGQPSMASARRGASLRGSRHAQFYTVDSVQNIIKTLILSFCFATGSFVQAENITLFQDLPSGVQVSQRNGKFTVQSPPISKNGTTSATAGKKTTVTAAQNNIITYNIDKNTLRHRLATVNINSLRNLANKYQAQQPAEDQKGNPAVQQNPVNTNLILNLFPSSEFEAKVKSITPTQFDGSFIQANLENGTMTMSLSKDGSIRGEVHSTQGTFTIRGDFLKNSQSQTVLIQEIDMSKLPRGNDMLELSPEMINSVKKNSNLEPSAQTSFSNSRDSNTIDLLVLYTTQAKNNRGGKSAIERDIRQEINKTNKALRDSGINSGRQIRPVHFQEVNYTQDPQRMGTDLRKLTSTRNAQLDPNGAMDEIHKLRKQYSADLVHLFVPNSHDVCGIAYTLSLPNSSPHHLASELYAELNRNRNNWSNIGTLGETLSTSWKNLRSFSVSAIDSCTTQYTFAHELGHNMGLHHDRYVEYHDPDNPPGHDPSYPLYPYAYGYVNQNFNAPAVCWRTIMAYPHQCFAQGYRGRTRIVTAFSNTNPRLAFPTSTRESVGQSGDSFTPSLNGGVDAVSALNNIWPNIARLMPSENACKNAISINGSSYSAGSGKQISINAQSNSYTFNLPITPGYCTEQANNHEPLQVLSSPGWASNASIENNNLVIPVLSNNTESERQGRIILQGLGLANNSVVVTITQSARSGGGGGTEPPANDCTSTRDKIYSAINSGSSCQEPSDSQLSNRQEINLQNKGIRDLNQNDFQGLTSLTDLDLSRNQINQLAAQVFSYLSALRYLYLDNNLLNTLNNNVFQNLNQLRTLSLDNNRLTNLPTNAFNGLSALRYLWLNDNNLSALPSGSLNGLNALRYLNLSGNNLSGVLPADVCRVLGNVNYVVLNDDQDLSGLCPSLSHRPQHHRQNLSRQSSMIPPADQLKTNADNQNLQAFSLPAKTFTQVKSGHFINRATAGIQVLPKKSAGRETTSHYAPHLNLLIYTLFSEDRQAILRMQKDGLSPEHILLITQDF